MGRLFGILEINLPSRENPHIIAQLIDVLEESYYGGMPESNENKDVVSAFENALEWVNQKFNQLIGEKRFYLVGNLNENTIKEKINLVIGVLKDNKLCISYSNDIGIYLLHKTKQDYKIVNLKKIDKVEEGGEIKEPQLFSNFLEGELNPPDYLFLCNSSFLNFISLERIQKTIVSLPIHKAAEYFKNSLLQTEGQNFAAIIIKNSPIGSEQNQFLQAVSSISELTKTESSTEKLLSPSLWSITKKFFNAIKILFQKIYSHTQKRLEAHKLSVEQQALPNLSDQGVAKSIVQTLINDLGRKIKKTLRKILTKSPFYGERMQRTKLWFRLKFIYIKTQLAKIPALSKLLFVIALTLIILFLFSTVYFKHVQGNSTDSPEYQNIVNQIEEKKSQAEADIIIGEETRAKNEITEAQRILSTLPIKSQKQKEKYQGLNAEIQAVIAKLRRIVNIDEPILLYDLSTESNINLANIIYYANYLLTFDSLNNTIYRYNLDTHEQKKFLSNLSDIGKIVKAKKIDDQILLYHDKNGFVQYKNGAYSPFAVALPANAKIIDFASYNNNFYILDQTSNQIYKYPKIESGYGPSVAWLKNAFDFKNIISLGIDTNIWLLDSKGQIYKFNKGIKRNFEIKNLDPALEAPLLLLTSDETNYLYIMEPKNSRLVVLDKEGQLVTQYYSPKFDNLKAFDVNEKEKRMFIVNDSKIYFINLTHIK